MTSHFDFLIRPQPDDSTCGPTCLHALYRHYGDDVSLTRIVDEVPQLPTGGTLGVMLACHALRRGYRASLLTYNLEVFDPTWFPGDAHTIAAQLRAQRAVKGSTRLRAATRAYLEFLELGGALRMEDLTPDVLRRPLDAHKPLLAGLSSTFLYRGAREGKLPLAKVRAVFGNEVAGLIDGVQQMAAVSRHIKPKDAPVLGQSQSQSDNVRRMLVALIDDVRIALIKLAERSNWISSLIF